MIRQRLAFGFAVEQGQRACWDVLVQFLRRKRFSKRTKAFKQYGLWSIEACRELAWSDPMGKCCYFLDLWAFACSIFHVPTRMTRLNRLNRESINL